MPKKWRVELRHCGGYDDVTVNVYELAEALRMLARWSPNVRAKCRLVRA